MEELCGALVLVWRDIICMGSVRLYRYRYHAVKGSIRLKLRNKENKSVHIKRIAEKATNLQQYFLDRKKKPGDQGAGALYKTLQSGISLCTTLASLGEALEKAVKGWSRGAIKSFTNAILTHAPLVGVAFSAKRMDELYGAVVLVWRDIICMEYVRLYHGVKGSIRLKLQNKENKSVLDPDIKSIAENATNLQQCFLDRKTKPGDKGTGALYKTLQSGISLCATLTSLGDALEKAVKGGSGGAITSLASTLSDANAILTHAPLVGIAFSALAPVLQAFVIAGQVDDKIPKTLQRISSIARALNAKIKLVEQVNSGGSQAQDDFRAISDLLDSGMNCVTRVMKSRNDNWFRSKWYVKAQRDDLREWNERADQFLSDSSSIAAIVSFHMIHGIAERFNRSNILSPANLIVLFVAIGLVGYVIILMKHSIHLLGEDNFILTWMKQVVQPWVTRKCIQCGGTLFTTMQDIVKD
eukprot:scaffold1101_cov52-Attheya_sp.AAC.2